MSRVDVPPSQANAFACGSSDKVHESRQKTISDTDIVEVRIGTTKQTKMVPSSRFAYIFEFRYIYIYSFRYKLYQGEDRIHYNKEKHGELANNYIRQVSLAYSNSIHMTLGVQ